MTDRILLVDDDQDHCEVLATTLRDLGYEATFTTSPGEALERVGLEMFAAVLTDLGMSDMDGLELCARIIGTRGDVPVIVLTGNGSMETAVAAMRAGAYDFLTKPIDPKFLGLSVARAVQHHRLQEEVKRLREESLERSAVDELIGTSPAMKRVHDLVARVGASDISVLIEGETGTGKELVARAFHAAGPRRNGPFVAINCGAVPANLFESELFGHVRGAFTGADTSRAGLLAEVSGGTLLLDEVGDMPLEMQTKLLRAIQERRVRPVGANAERSFDVRILAATHRDLELENCIERAVALARLDHLSAEDLPEKIAAYRAPFGGHPSEEPGEILTLDEVNRRYVERTLVALHGNKSLAANLLGLDRRTLYRRLEKYESAARDSDRSRHA